MKYFTPNLPSTLKMLDEIAASGRILLDTSAATYVFGLQRGTSIETPDLFLFLLQSAMTHGKYEGLIRTQTAYIDHLTSLSESGRIFTVDSVLKEEMKGLQFKSSQSALDLTSMKYRQEMGKLTQSIDRLLTSLQKNIFVTIGVPGLDAVREEIRDIYMTTETPPSQRDRLIVASAFYLSAANGERISILSNDRHIFELSVIHYGRNLHKENPLELDVSCFSFDREHGLDLTELISKEYQNEVTFNNYARFLSNLTEGALF